MTKQYQVLLSKTSLTQFATHMKTPAILKEAQNNTRMRKLCRLKFGYRITVIDRLKSLRWQVVLI